MDKLQALIQALTTLLSGKGMEAQAASALANEISTVCAKVYEPAPGEEEKPANPDDEQAMKTAVASLVRIAKVVGCEDGADVDDIEAAVNNLVTLSQVALTPAPVEDEKAKRIAARQKAFEENERLGKHAALERVSKGLAAKLNKENPAIYDREMAKAKPLLSGAPKGSAASLAKTKTDSEQGGGDAVYTRVKTRQAEEMTRNPKLSEAEAYGIAFRSVQAELQREHRIPPMLKAEENDEVGAAE